MSPEDRIKKLEARIGALEKKAKSYDRVIQREKGRTILRANELSIRDRLGQEKVKIDTGIDFLTKPGRGFVDLKDEAGELSIHIVACHRDPMIRLEGEKSLLDLSSACLEKKTRAGRELSIEETFYYLSESRESLRAFHDSAFNLQTA